jgi:hypothetical protein
LDRAFSGDDGEGEDEDEDAAKHKYEELGAPIQEKS